MIEKWSLAGSLQFPFKPSGQITRGWVFDIFHRETGNGFTNKKTTTQEYFCFLGEGSKVFFSLPIGRNKIHRQKLEILYLSAPIFEFRNDIFHFFNTILFPARFLPTWLLWEWGVKRMKLSNVHTSIATSLKLLPLTDIINHKR